MGSIGGVPGRDSSRSRYASFLVSPVPGGPPCRCLRRARPFARPKRERADDPDLAYGLAVEGVLRPVYELGYWSLDAFEVFGRGALGSQLQSSSVFRFIMPLSGYVRSLARGGYGRLR
jgi:hypothetical protein